MSEVHMVIRSQDSKDIYPFNKPHDFTVNLKPQFSLEGEWQIGVREISHSTKVVNLKGKEPNTIAFQWMDEEGGRPWGGKTIQLAEDASFLTPHEIITYINEAAVLLPRRPNPTYTLKQLVTFDANGNAIRKTDNAQALDDIPRISVYQKVRPVPAYIYMQVKLFALDRNGRTRLRYHTETKIVRFSLSRWVTWNTSRRNQWIKDTLYSSFTSLPKRTLTPSEKEQIVHHQYFSLTDVASLSYDPCLRKFKLACKDNIERVTGLKMTMTSFLGERMGLDGDQAIEVQCGSSATFAYVQTLAAGYEALAVNCSLVRPCQLGDTSANLLTLTPLMASNVDRQSKYAHNKYKRIKYAPLLHSTFEAVRIQFKSIKGKDVQFASGAEETHISLHLIRLPCEKHNYG
jgi:hypothetical protein